MQIFSLAYEIGVLKDERPRLKLHDIPAPIFKPVVHDIINREKRLTSSGYERHGTISGQWRDDMFIIGYIRIGNTPKTKSSKSIAVGIVAHLGYSWDDGRQEWPVEYGRW
jgi:hypothetical protein